MDPVPTTVFKSKLVYWDTRSRRKNTAVRVEVVDPFDARGMRRVYARGDHWPSEATFHMHVWVDRADRLLVRFWSRSNKDDDLSLELFGMSVKSIRELHQQGGPSDAWIPKVLRELYDDWIIARSWM